MNNHIGNDCSIGCRNILCEHETRGCLLCVGLSMRRLSLFPGCMGPCICPQSKTTSGTAHNPPAASLEQVGVRDQGSQKRRRQKSECGQPSWIPPVGWVPITDRPFQRSLSNLILVGKDCRIAEYLVRHKSSGRGDRNTNHASLSATCDFHPNVFQPLFQSLGKSMNARK